MEMTGAQILMEGFLREGVERIFGYAGATICPIMDALMATPRIGYTLVRTEQNAGNTRSIHIIPDSEGFEYQQHDTTSQIRQCPLEGQTNSDAGRGQHSHNRAGLHPQNTDDGNTQQHIQPDPYKA